MTYFQGQPRRRHRVMVQPMCFPSLIARLFCFSALFLSSGSQFIVYLFIYWWVLFFFFFIMGASKKRRRTLRRSGCARGLTSPVLTLLPPAAPPPVEVAAGVEGLQIAMLINRFASESRQGKIKAGNLLWPP